MAEASRDGSASAFAVKRLNHVDLAEQDEFAAPHPHRAARLPDRRWLGRELSRTAASSATRSSSVSTASWKSMTPRSANKPSTRGGSEIEFFLKALRQTRDFLEKSVVDDQVAGRRANPSKRQRRLEVAARKTLLQYLPYRRLKALRAGRQSQPDLGGLAVHRLQFPGNRGRVLFAQPRAKSQSCFEVSWQRPPHEQPTSSPAESQWQRVSHVAIIGLGGGVQSSAAVTARYLLRRPRRPSAASGSPASAQRSCCALQASWRRHDPPVPSATK